MKQPNQEIEQEEHRANKKRQGYRRSIPNPLEYGKMRNWNKALEVDKRFNEEMKERQKDLLKFYKYIRTCTNKKCKQKFGRDSDSRYCSGLCPLCQIEQGFGGSSRWDRQRDRIKQKHDSGGSGKARRGLNG